MQPQSHRPSANPPNKLPTLRQVDTINDVTPGRHGSGCPAEHPTAFVDKAALRSGSAGSQSSAAPRVPTSEPTTRPSPANTPHAQDGWSITPTSHNSTLVNDTACTTQTPLRSVINPALWGVSSRCPAATRGPSSRITPRRPPFTQGPGNAKARLREGSFPAHLICVSNVIIHHRQMWPTHRICQR